MHGAGSEDESGGSDYEEAPTLGGGRRRAHHTDSDDDAETSGEDTEGVLLCAPRVKCPLPVLLTTVINGCCSFFSHSCEKSVSWMRQASCAYFVITGHAMDFLNAKALQALGRKSGKSL